MSLAVSIPIRASIPTPPPGATRTEENRFLLRAFRYHSRTFSLAAKLLPRRVRLPIATVYLYCRTVDNLADEFILEAGPDRAQMAIDQTRRALDATLDGRPPDGLLWQRLAEVHERFDLLPHPLHQLLDGAEWDLDGRPIHTTADLLAYSDLVAGSVGAMMLPFLVESRAHIAVLEPPARALGKAMQITNILRDVGEDNQQLGRVYLPKEQLDSFGLAPDELFGQAVGGGPKPAYRALVESIMAQAELLYQEAQDGIEALPGNARTGIHAAARMYREIMNEVRAADYDNLRRRAVVPLTRKLRLLVQDDYDRRKEQLTA